MYKGQEPGVKFSQFAETLLDSDETEVEEEGDSEDDDGDYGHDGDNAWDDEEEHDEPKATEPD